MNAKKIKHNMNNPPRWGGLKKINANEAKVFLPGEIIHL